MTCGQQRKQNNHYNEDTNIFDFEIEGKLYFVSDEVNGDIWEYIDEDNFGKQIGELIDGKPQWF